MILKRHCHNSVQSELKQHGLFNLNSTRFIPTSLPKPTDRIVQTTSLYQSTTHKWLFMDKFGIFLHQSIFSPYECVFVEDLPFSRKKVLGSIRQDLSIRDIASFLISADIVRTYLQTESTMKLVQVHSRMMNVQGYYEYHDSVKTLRPFSFSITTDQFGHVSICRHSL